MFDNASDQCPLVKTSRLPPTRTSRDQRSQGKRRCGARPGRKAGSERVSRESFLPAFLESLSGGSGTAVCYPTLQKTLQGAGRELKAFSIIQQLELPAAPVGARGRLARAPGLGLAGLGGGLVVGGTAALMSHSCPPALLQRCLWGGAEGAAVPGRQAWSCLLPCRLRLCCGMEAAGWRSSQSQGGVSEGSQGGRACLLSAGEGQAA